MISPRIQKHGSLLSTGLTLAAFAFSATAGFALDASGTKVVNVLDGVIGVGSQDAVTGNQLQATNDALNATNETVSDLTSDLRILTRDFNGLDSDVTGIEGRLNDGDTGLVALDGKITAAGTRIDGLDGRITTNATDITGIEGRLNDGDTGLVALDGKITAADTRINGLDGRITDNADGITGINDRLNDASTGLVALDDKITAADTRITNEVATLDGRITTEVAAINADIATLDNVAVKYVNDTDAIINLRAATTLNNVQAITGLADVTPGDSDQTRAVNIASAKVIAAEVADDAINTHLDDAHKAIAFSTGATASSIAFGVTGSQAIGSNARVNSDNSIALGTDAFVSDQATGSTALGTAANARHANSVALGANTTTTEADTVAIGDRTLSQVAAKDLTAANTGYAATTGQLYNAATSTADILGGGATVNTDGTLTGWNVDITDAAGNTVNATNVADALTGLDTRITGEVATLNTRIDDALVAHADDVTALDTKIDQEIAARAALIRTEARLDASNGPVLDAAGNAITDIHIGGNSLITAEVAVVEAATGNIVLQQQLSAQDATGAAIDLDIANGSKLLVNGDEVWGKTAVQGAIATANDALRTELNTRIDGVDTRVTNLETAIQNQANYTNRMFNQHHKAIQKLQRGISMAAALQTPVIDPGKKNAAKFGLAHYDGKTGLAGGYARRIQDSVIVNAEIATSDDFDEVIARAGVNYSW
jgi:hypothetical protein